MNLRSLLFSLLIFTSFIALAQKPKVENLPNFKQKRIHFGFSLGLNNASYTLDRKQIDFKNDSLLRIDVESQSGFNLGIVSALHFNEFFSLRFVPTLSFAQRNLNYTFNNPSTGESEVLIKPLESTNIELPLLFKYRSQRLNNFAAYLIAGGKYVIDLASNEDVNNADLRELIVKQQSQYVAAEVGIGTDFFLPYFKFSIEGKMSYGIKNIIVRDNTIFSNPIERMLPKMFILSLHFEG
ncbi:PorT family protein [bacterium]|nr:PorT family protein [bacterium]